MAAILYESLDLRIESSIKLTIMTAQKAYLTVFAINTFAIFLTVITIDDLKLYHNPFLIGGAAVAVGIAIGFLLWKRFRPYLANLNSEKSYLFKIGLYIHMIPIGVMIFSINQMNKLFIETGECESRYILEKFQKDDKNYLVLILPGKTDTFRVSKQMWKSSQKGHELEVCSQHSPLQKETSAILEQ